MMEGIVLDQNFRVEKLREITIVQEANVVMLYARSEIKKVYAHFIRLLDDTPD